MSLWPRTLGEYRDFCVVSAGEDNRDNRAVKYFDEKIKKQGRDEVVLADQSQMMILIASLLRKIQPYKAG